VGDSSYSSTCSPKRRLFGGWAFYLDKGKPTFHYNTVNIFHVFHYNIASSQVLVPGKHTLVVDFNYDGGGMGKGATATLSEDGRQVAHLMTLGSGITPRLAFMPFV
jgi:hypothetical protein